MTNLNDSERRLACDALTQSNSIPGTVLIDFQAGLTGTIELTTRDWKSSTTTGSAAPARRRSRWTAT